MSISPMPDKVSAETALVRKYASRWLTFFLPKLLDFSMEFFDCAAYLAGNHVSLAKNILKGLNEYESQNGTGKLPLDRLANLETSTPVTLFRALPDLLQEYPFIRDTVVDTIRGELAKNMELPVSLMGKKGLLEPVRRLFGLDEKALELCLFFFATKNYEALWYWFRSELSILDYEKSYIMALMLDIEESEYKILLDGLCDMGIISFGNSEPGLIDEIEAVIKGIGGTLQGRLCPVLKASRIPLYDFNLDREEIDHIARLLKIQHSEPCNILVYGKPGLGKSTFVRALATSLGVKAYAALGRDSASLEARKISLIACLNLASRYRGSFVVVDDAEMLLNSDSAEFDDSFSRYWLNSFLEEKGNKVIWICNEVSGLDASVKRRFAYSVKFPELDGRERFKLWKKVATRLKVESRISEKEIEQLVKNYSVPVSCIETSLRLARAVAKKNDFVPSVERNLKAYVTLLNDGEKAPGQTGVLDECVLEGISASMPIKDFLSRMQRLAAFLEKADRRHPGMGSVLFYGVSGSGKSFLGKYLAKMLGRSALVKRASELMSAYVGETEKNIAEAFKKARETDAILIIDEVDSFLPPRGNARYNWEVTMTNEFLTSLEEYEGICICTTNLRDCLDSAIMRRFSLKIEFRYAGPEQLLKLYEKILEPVTGKKLEEEEKASLIRHRHLCAGDFHAVRNQFFLDCDVTSSQLLEALAREERLKIEAGMKKIGFGGRG